LTSNGGLDPLLISKLGEVQDKCFLQNHLMPGFTYIKKEPLAAGSICNVYLINYKGRPCILKILHKGVHQNITYSISMLKWLKKIWSFFSKNNPLHLFNLDDYHTYLKRQLDLNLEGNNQMQMRELFKENSNIFIPEIYDKGHNFIVMEYLEGHKFQHYISDHPVDENECRALIYCVLYKMIAKGNIHGDFHMGNFIFFKKNDKLCITILDFGIMCEITPEQTVSLQLALNFNLNSESRTKHMANFICSIDTSLTDKSKKYDLTKSRSMKTIIEIMLKEHVQFPVQFITLFTTLQILTTNSKEQDISVLNYAIENDFVDY
jgi:predicted unusual protein kinase regulating ubiquinone biosynthesis (AarF/ABC1/UbiB family)